MKKEPVQILRRMKAKRGEERQPWAFVAHGARFERAEAEVMAKNGPARGCEYKLVRV